VSARQHMVEAANPVPALTRANTAAELTATAFLGLLAQRKISVVEYVAACADRIEALDPQIRAWQSLDLSHALDRARQLDAGLANAPPERLMTGVPVGVKDIFNTYDLPTGMGSEILEHYTPGNDARVVSNIRLERGIVMGKTVSAEFAVHHPGPTLNPHDPARTPGTSSSGSAAAVAARMVPLALGTQTGGSIIRPASYCGIMGYKPSFGLIPRTGILKTTDSLDTVGYLARSVDDLALAFEVTRVRGHNYPISERALNDPARQAVHGRRWRIGVVSGPKSASESAAARASLDAVLQRLGGDAAIDLAPALLPPIFDEAHAVHEALYRRALAYYFKLEWGAASEKFSPVLRRMIEAGFAMTPDDYARALARQAALAHELDRVLQDYDVLLGLSTADEAPLGLGAEDLPDHCLIWTMCGVPALSLPLLQGSTGLPVGVQLVARRFADYKLLEFARLLERSAP
jgi:Asp-tRNA(Asn)/Glu-tRNA(Gln) amidotransferase A subunit family amidase